MANSMDREAIRTAMEAETYYEPEEALEIGWATMVDSTSDPVQMEMSDTLREFYLPRLPEAAECLVISPQLRDQERQKTVERLRIHHDPATFQIHS